MGTISFTQLDAREINGIVGSAELAIYASCKELKDFVGPIAAEGIDCSQFDHMHQAGHSCDLDAAHITLNEMLNAYDATNMKAFFSLYNGITWDDKKHGASPAIFEKEDENNKEYLVYPGTANQAGNADFVEVITKEKLNAYQSTCYEVVKQRECNCGWKWSWGRWYRGFWAHECEMCNYTDGHACSGTPEVVRVNKGSNLAKKFRLIKQYRSNYIDTCKCV